MKEPETDKKFNWRLVLWVVVYALILWKVGL